MSIAQGRREEVVSIVVGSTFVRLSPSPLPILSYLAGITASAALFLCTSACSNEGAGVADDGANLDCMRFSALYTGRPQKPVVGNSSPLTPSVPKEQG